MVDSFNMDSPQQPTDPDPVPSAPPAGPSSPAQLIVSAVHAQMLAKRTRAVANLNNYLLNSVGVGEHPDVVEESIKLIEDIEYADSMIEALNRVISS
jgi:hypothetical protein